MLLLARLNKFGTDIIKRELKGKNCLDGFSYFTRFELAKIIKDK